MADQSGGVRGQGGAPAPLLSGRSKIRWLGPHRHRYGVAMGSLSGTACAVRAYVIRLRAAARPTPAHRNAMGICR